MVRFLLKRPIFALVCSLSILLAGIVVIPVLPIAQFPKITPPVVTVTATYTGATAATVESSVTTPLEEAINGVDGLRYISSTSSSDGTSTILCTFNLGRDLNIAASDVQNAVGTASARLPSAVTQTGVTVTKNAGTFVIAYGFASTNPRYDTLYLSNYVDRNIIDSLKRIPGVSSINVFGQRKYAMRLWVVPKHQSRRDSLSADPHDVAGVHLRDLAAGVRQRRGQHEPPVAGNDASGRNDFRDGSQLDVRAGAVRRHRAIARALLAPRRPGTPRPGRTDDRARRRRRPRRELRERRPARAPSRRSKNRTTHSCVHIAHVRESAPPPQ